MKLASRDTPRAWLRVAAGTLFRLPVPRVVDEVLALGFGLGLLAVEQMEDTAADVRERVGNACEAVLAIESFLRGGR